MLVKLHVGKHKSKTRVWRGTSTPIWNEEFVFRVSGVEEGDDVVVSVLHYKQDHHLSAQTNVSTGLIGRVLVPLSSVVGKENQTLLPPTWFDIDKLSDGKFVNIECGKILLSLSLQGKWESTSGEKVNTDKQDVNLEGVKEVEGGTKDHGVVPKMGDGVNTMTGST